MRSLSVIKIGGKVAEDDQSLEAFLDQFVQIDEPKILIHGGGVIATEIASKLGIETNMVDGRRITNKPMLDVATMVYAGLVNKKLVAKLQALGVNAVGLSGADLNLILSRKRNPEPIDFGWVGDIEHVETRFLSNLIAVGVTPVLAPLTHDGKGNLLNTNADSIASFVARALSKMYQTKLVLCFDMPGVMAEGKVIPEIDSENYIRLKQEGIVKDGMIPKLDLGFEALKEGVQEVIIKNFNDLENKDKGTVLIQ